MISTNRKLKIDSQLAALTVAESASRPSLARTLLTAWRAYGHRTATYHTELLLSIVYFTVLGPSGLLARLSGKQLLDLSSTPRTSYWLRRKPVDKSLAGMQRQY